MRRKGFTLVELLAVIAILGVIITLVTVQIINSIDEASNRAYQTLVKSIENSAELYMAEHSTEYPTIDQPGSIIYIQLQNLVDDGYFDAPIKNPKKDIVFSLQTNIKITVMGESNLQAQFLEDSSNPVVAFGTDGHSGYIKTASTTVTVTDEGGLDNNSLKYLWNNSVVKPLETDFSLTFDNGDTITSQTNLNGSYYLWILAKDILGNTTITRTNVFNLDNIIPVITRLGNSPVSVEIGSSYTDAGATATDNIDGNITANITPISTVNPNVLGTYTVTYNVNDNAGNAATPVIRTINVIDTTDPIIAFGTNGNTTYAKTRSTTVTVSDLGGVNTSSLKYQWNTSTTTPTEGSFSTTFTNGNSISSTAGVTGGYYLWILAKDASNNTIITRSNVFNLDNTAPTLASVDFNGYTPGSWTASDIDATLTMSDGHSGIWGYESSTNGGSTWTSSQTTSPASLGWSGSSDVNIAILFRARDNAGNVSASSSSYAIKMDKVSPTITSVNLNGYTANTWTTSNITISLSATDNGSGIQKYQYTNNGGTSWSDCPNPWVINFDGQWTLSFRAVDNLGRIGTVSASSILKRDATVPTITNALAGTMIYTDPTFASGLNSTNVYNNTGNGNVTRTRVSITGAPLGSGYGLNVQTVGVASPSWGGFYFGNQSAANKVYVTRLVANIPAGRTINFNTNLYGTGGTYSWWTSQAGTGTWQEYIFQINTGASGTFGTTNFFSISGGSTPTPEVPLNWYVAYGTVHDTTLQGTANNILFKATDATSGITGYGINQSSTTPPTFTAVTATSTFATGILNITADGTYYVWVKDAANNQQKTAVVVTYAD